MLIALAMILTSLVPSFTASAAFSDVDDSNSYVEAISTLSTLQVINGYEDGSFQPEKEITRAEYTKMIVYMLGMDSFTTPITTFTDVPESHWANAYIKTAFDMGIINGFDDNSFRPLDFTTRAEASDVANAIYDRTSAVMLSGECAQGDYPVECVKTMAKIANRVEPTINYWKRFEQNEDSDLSTLEMSVANSACVLAKNMKADAIVAYTNTGDSARRLAGLGAGCPILAVTDNRKTFYQLGLVWNVYPVYVDSNAMAGRAGYFNKEESDDERKHRKRGYALDISYNWGW